MVMPLDTTQSSYVLPLLRDVPDEIEDKPEPGLSVDFVGAFQLPKITFGAAALSNQYNNDDLLISDIPLRTVRLALRYGIRAFDTSPYYGPSEILLGTILKTLRSEFPRSSYQLMTKCGRYGLGKDTFDYSPATIRKSIERSLARLHTDYLDVVYLHDVEFIATPVAPSASGDHPTALGTDAVAYGLAEGDEAKIRGPGDQQILDAVAELRKMQAEGLIRRIGITGYPLYTLLRLALLVLHTPPYAPLDALLSYSQSNIQNAAFATFAPALQQRARVAQLAAASPFNMGLLAPVPPAWHPAPPALRAAAREANARCVKWPGGLPNVALGFAMRSSAEGGAAVDGTPTVVGFSTPHEVHEAVRVWRDLREGENVALRSEKEKEVANLFKMSGYLGWSWASPPESG